MDNLPKQIYCSTLNRVFPSLRSVCTELGVKYLSLRKVLGGAAKTTKGYSFEWYDPKLHPTAEQGQQ